MGLGLAKKSSFLPQFVRVRESVLGREIENDCGGEDLELLMKGTPRKKKGPRKELDRGGGDQVDGREPLAGRGGRAVD